KSGHGLLPVMRKSAGALQKQHSLCGEIQCGFDFQFYGRFESLYFLIKSHSTQRFLIPKEFSSFSLKKKKCKDRSEKRKQHVRVT
ncbi:hypothetical protein PSY47_23285, partial [Shigella flexneri]|nr:hypothetical protein [Shigella flexneri]